MNLNLPTKRRYCKRGLSLLELFIVIIILGVLAGMLLPVTRSTREAARRTTCANHLRQLVLAELNYESSYGYLPSAMGGSGFGSAAEAGTLNRRSGLILLLPFIEEAATWEQISQPSSFSGTDYPAMGPAPWNQDYPPWQTEISGFRCPSATDGQSVFGQTNYAFCIGDMARGIHQPTLLRGAHACQLNARLDEIKDGTSCTIAMAEIGTAREKWTAGHYATGRPAELLDNPSLAFECLDSERNGYYAGTVELGVPGRGGCWADGAAGCSLVNTVLPPNSPSCAVGGTQAVDGLYSAGGFHVGVVNVAMLDGSVHTIAEDIDAGDLTQPTLTVEQMAADQPSPFGVWGALGTSAAADDSTGW